MVKSQSRLSLRFKLFSCRDFIHLVKSDLQQCYDSLHFVYSTSTSIQVSDRTLRRLRVLASDGMRDLHLLFLDRLRHVLYQNVGLGKNV